VLGAQGAGTRRRGVLTHLVRLRGQAAGEVGRPFDKMLYPPAPSRPSVPGDHTMKRTLVLGPVAPTTPTPAPPPPPTPPPPPAPRAGAPGYAGGRSCLPDPLTDANSGKPEAEGAEPVRRRAAEADRRPAVGADEAPAAAAAHPVVGAPLPHIAMHVAQTQLVR